jgi:hypothetical protein
VVHLEVFQRVKPKPQPLAIHQILGTPGEAEDHQWEFVPSGHHRRCKIVTIRGAYDHRWYIVGKIRLLMVFDPMNLT